MRSDECPRKFWQQAFGTLEPQKAQDAEAARQPAHTQPLVQPQQPRQQPKPGQVHEQPAKDQPPQQLDRPGTPPRPGFGLEHRSQHHLQRVHVHPGGADRRARVAHQAIQLVLDEVRRDFEMALGQRSGHANPPARPFGLVQRQHVRWTGRQAQPAANAGQHVCILVTQKWVRRFEGWQRAQCDVA